MHILPAVSRDLGELLEEGGLEALLHGHAGAGRELAAAVLADEVVAGVLAGLDDALFFSVRSWEGVTSEMPMEKPCSPIQRAESLARRAHGERGDAGRVLAHEDVPGCSSWSRPPRTTLSRTPHMSWLFWKQT